VGELDAITTPTLRPSVDALLANGILASSSMCRVCGSSTVGRGRAVFLYKKAKEYGGVVTVQGLCDQPLAIFKLLRPGSGSVGVNGPRAQPGSRACGIAMISSNLSGLTGCDLLRAWFSEEIQFRDPGSLGRPVRHLGEFQRLAFELTGLTVPEEMARAVFKSLATIFRICAGPKAADRVRTAALDLSDRLESFCEKKACVELSHESLVRMAFVIISLGCRISGAFRALPKARSSGERYGRLLSLLMIDVDGFKEINDHFGHMAGNLALKHVAGLLRNFVRETD